MATTGYSPGLSYTGIDEKGVRHNGNLMVGTVTGFVQRCFRSGWKELTVVDSMGTGVAGVFTTPKNHLVGTMPARGWFSDVA